MSTPKGLIRVLLTMLSIMLCALMATVYRIAIIRDDYEILARNLDSNSMANVSELGKSIAGLMDVHTLFYPRQATIHGNPSQVIGIDGTYCASQRKILQYGRTIWDEDVLENRRVALIDTALSSALYGGENAVGAVIEVFGTSYEVIGVYRSESPRGEALIPWPSLNESNVAFIRGVSRQAYSLMRQSIAEIIDRIGGEITFISMAFEKMRVLLGFVCGAILASIVAIPYAAHACYKGVSRVLIDAYHKSRAMDLSKHTLLSTAAGIVAALMKFSSILLGACFVIYKSVRKLLVFDADIPKLFQPTVASNHCASEAYAFSSLRGLNDLEHMLRMETAAITILGLFVFCTWIAGRRRKRRA
ncbi:MAG: ABC transporter permease [Christensenellaceae bacterium]|nr:ABC transporter permease [Christensenellaceae bacterium]